MIAYQYECWKCDLWHDATAESVEELTEITAEIGVTVRLTNN
jgi:hypothetical protein